MKTQSVIEEQHRLSALHTAEPSAGPVPLEQAIPSPIPDVVQYRPDNGFARLKLRMTFDSRGSFPTEQRNRLALAVAYEIIARFQQCDPIATLPLDTFDCNQWRKLGPFTGDHALKIAQFYMEKFDSQVTSLHGNESGDQASDDGKLEDLQRSLQSLMTCFWFHSRADPIVFNRLQRRAPLRCFHSQYCIGNRVCSSLEKAAFRKKQYSKRKLRK